MAGTKGEVEYAVRRALNKLDEWNDVTGVFVKHTCYYYEIQAVIEDAVHCGFQRAMGCEESLPSESDAVDKAWDRFQKTVSDDGA